MFDEKPNAVAPKAFGAVHSGSLPATSRNNALGTPMGRERAEHTTAKTALCRSPITNHRSLVPSRFRTKAFTLAKQRDPESVRGFTLVELLVSLGVLVLLVFLASQLMNSMATVTTLAHKKMDADSQTRQLFDRMAIDFDHMVKRSDIDYYLKSSWFATGTPPGPAGVRTVRQSWLADDRGIPFNGNDQIAFYCTVPGYGYFPTPTVESPLSIVAYRINKNITANNPAYLRLERMGRGLLWNAAPIPPPNMATPTPTATPFSAAPTVFIPVPLASPLPAVEWPGAAAATPACGWAASNTASWGSEAEIIGPDVFRFEYYYLLKGQTNPTLGSTPYPSRLTDTPWDTEICWCPPIPPMATPTPTGTPIASPTPPGQCCHVAPQGMQDVAAVVVAIAVIDPKSRALLDNSAQVLPPNDNITRLGAQLIDWGDTRYATQLQWQTTPGLLAGKWREAIDANIYPNGLRLPAPALSGIRVYERYFYLRTSTLLTP